MQGLGSKTLVLQVCSGVTEAQDGCCRDGKVFYPFLRSLSFRSEVLVEALGKTGKTVMTHVGLLKRTVEVQELN